MHACGHDTHMTAWIGVARLMTANKGKWSGTLVMIGQPAEERGAGARMMLEDGLYTRFPKPVYVLAFHDAAQFPAGKIGYRSEEPTSELQYIMRILYADFGLKTKK